jgi:hypothetical protein
MRRSRAAILSALFVGLMLPIAAAPALARDPAAVAHDRTLAYWTPARIAAAQPRDFVRNANGQLEPRKGKPGGGSGTNVIGASWNLGGLVKQVTGKVVFTLDSGDYICSGTVVSDGTPGRSLVISAGHCAYDWATKGGFARNWMFIPDFDRTPTYTCSQTFWGCWTASALVVNSGFANAGSFNDTAVQYDWSFAVITQTTSNGKTLDDTVGSLPLLAGSGNQMATGAQVYDFGYPAAGRYHGSDLIYCADQVFYDPFVSNKTYGIDCNMTGGSSGGPWFSPFDAAAGNSGTIRAVNSYGYSGQTKEYASMFNQNTTNTFNTAQTATSNTKVN